ncbi:MAG: DNA-binding response regulator [Rhodospirillales bacterium]|nr:DNA-binding response regulator [Rhodospirillales bacterium]
MRLLVAEDDSEIAQFLVRGLSESGHVVDHAAEGETAWALAQEEILDVLLLDRRLPVLDGLALVKALRAAGQTVPVLMLSAVASTADRVEGMRAGCDDYLAKPFAFAELLARVEALARRARFGSGRPRGPLRLANLVLDPDGYSVRRGGRAIPLQRREFLLLECLLRHAGQVVTRAMLLSAAWDYEFEPRGNIVDMHMHRLRQKLDEGHEVKLLHTVPGAGYMLTVRDIVV